MCEWKVDDVSLRPPYGQRSGAIRYKRNEIPLIVEERKRDIVYMVSNGSCDVY